MPGWTGGYNTDIAYTEHYHRDLTPAVLRFACLVAQRRSPDPGRPLAILDLGCGNGLNAAVVAATHPACEVHGVDFMPSHVAKARLLAEAGGLSNVTFHEADFGAFAETPGLPAFDIITLHGVWAWVGPEVRRSVLEVLKRHLKPGGLFYLCYNALPGWSGVAPLQHILKAATEATAAGGAMTRIEEGLDFIDRLIAVDPIFARNNKPLLARLRLNRNQDRRYLVHEYLNENWQPHHFAEVAGALAEAKLDFVGSSRLLETVDAANMTAEQRAFLATIPDPMLRETARDFILNQHFRTDVYVKGATPLFPAEIDRDWAAARFVLSVERATVPDSVVTHLGRVTLTPAIYEPILDALSEGPLSTADLAARPAIAGIDRPALRQALTVLVGAGHVDPCLPEAGSEARAASTTRFNDALLERSLLAPDLPWLASPLTGSAISVDRFTQAYLLADRRGLDPADLVWSVLQRDNQRLVRDGRRLETADENRVEIQARYREFRDIAARRMARLGI